MEKSNAEVSNHTHADEMHTHSWVPGDNHLHGYQKHLGAEAYAQDPLCQIIRTRPGK